MSNKFFSRGIDSSYLIAIRNQLGSITNTLPEQDNTTHIDIYGINGLVQTPNYNLQYLYFGTPVSLYIKYYIDNLNKELCFSFFGSNNIHINNTLLLPYSYINFTITEDTPSIILYEFLRSEIVSIFIKKYKLINFSFTQHIYVNYINNGITTIIPAILNIIYIKSNKSIALQLTPSDGFIFTKNINTSPSSISSYYTALIPTINFSLDVIKNPTAKKNKVVSAPTI
jgi:hypothetical protein